MSVYWGAPGSAHKISLRLGGRWLVDFYLNLIILFIDFSSQRKWISLSQSGWNQNFLIYFKLFFVHKHQLNCIVSLVISFSISFLSMSLAIFLYHWMYVRVLCTEYCVWVSVCICWCVTFILLIQQSSSSSSASERKFGRRRKKCEWIDAERCIQFLKNSDKTISHWRRNSTIFSFEYRFRFHLCFVYEMGYLSFSWAGAKFKT